MSPERWTLISVRSIPVVPSEENQADETVRFIKSATGIQGFPLIGRGLSASGLLIECSDLFVCVTGGLGAVPMSRQTGKEVTQWHAEKGRYPLLTKGRSRMTVRSPTAVRFSRKS